MVARQLSEIQAEYQQQSALLGHVIYQIESLKSDAFKMRRHMKRLNQEAQKAAGKQKEVSSDLGSVPQTEEVAQAAHE